MGQDLPRKTNRESDEQHQADLHDFHGSRQDSGKYYPDDKKSLKNKKQKVEQKDHLEISPEENVCHTKLVDKDGTENGQNENSISSVSGNNISGNNISGNNISGNEDVQQDESDASIKEELQKQTEKLEERKSMFPRFPRIPFVAPVKFPSDIIQVQENPKFPPHLSHVNPISKVQVKSDVRSIFNNARQFAYPDNPFQSGAQSDLKNTNNLSGVGYQDMMAMKCNINDLRYKHANNISPATIMTNCNARNAQLLIGKNTYESGIQYSNDLDLNSHMNSYISPLQYKNALKKLALSMRLSEQSRAKIIWRRQGVSSLCPSALENNPTVK